MASKARNANDLLKDLDDLGIGDESTTDTNSKAPAAGSSGSTSNNTSSKVTPTSSTASGNGGNTTGNNNNNNNSTNEDEDVFGDIEKQLAAKPAGGASSRPETPRLAAGAAGKSRTAAVAAGAAAAAADYTPSTSAGPSSNRTSEERRTGNGRGTAAQQQQQQKQAESASGGGGWWGSMFSAATAAVKQAENLAKDFRGNEEAMKWAEQVRGYGAGLQNLSTDLRSRALPTFTSLMSHIAPPISSHERLQIHITHDILNYPSLDPLIYDTFSRVMVQVEGGDLLVIQRGGESRARSSSELAQGYRGGMLSSGTRWTDGPWWRDDSSKRDIGAVAGLKEGTRLARVSAESFSKEFFDAQGGIEAAAEKATQSLSDSNPTRTSDIFLAIQAVSYTQDGELFASSSSSATQTAATTTPSSDEKSALPSATVVDNDDPDSESDAADAEQLVFAIYLHDPLHSLSFSTLSQPFPKKWTSWLDASSSPEAAAAAQQTGRGSASSTAAAVLPDSILEIISAGGVDPREWVAEWMEEVLGLAVGVIAQRYVARRMGVDEGGLTRGKRRPEEVGVGGEAARAI